MKLYTATQKGIDYSEEVAHIQAAKGYEYRMSDDYDWHPYTWTQELLANLQHGPNDEDSLIESYFAYQAHEEVPKSTIKKHLAFLEKGGYVTVTEIED